MEVDELLSEYDLGEQGKSFIESPLGQSIVKQALDDIESYRHQLEGVDPASSNDIMHIQIEIKKRRLAIDWIVQIINAGQNAGENLELIESED